MQKKLSRREVRRAEARLFATRRAGDEKLNAAQLRAVRKFIYDKLALKKANDDGPTEAR